MILSYYMLASINPHFTNLKLITSLSKSIYIIILIKHRIHTIRISIKFQIE